MVVELVEAEGLIVGVGLLVGEELGESEGLIVGVGVFEEVGMVVGEGVGSTSKLAVNVLSVVTGANW